MYTTVTHSNIFSLSRCCPMNETSIYKVLRICASLLPVVNKFIRTLNLFCKPCFPKFLLSIYYPFTQDIRHRSFVTPRAISRVHCWQRLGQNHHYPFQSHLMFLIIRYRSLRFSWSRLTKDVYFSMSDVCFNRTAVYYSLWPSKFMVSFPT